MPADSLSQNLGAAITAIGALGTAAFGLLEAIKPAFKSINRIGFDGIHRTVAALTPPETNAAGAASAPMNALPQARVLQTLESNWVNGNDLASQKAIAKSLIKLHMSAGNAAALARAANVDEQLLTEAAVSMAAGKSLDQPHSDTYARFDLIVTAMLDECYQCSDEIYRNKMRALAAAIAVLLAMAGGCILGFSPAAAGAAANNLGWWAREMATALMVGLLATPLAPIAKDLSTALATAVNTMQLVKKV